MHPLHTFLDLPMNLFPFTTIKFLQITLFSIRQFICSYRTRVVNLFFSGKRYRYVVKFYEHDD